MDTGAGSSYASAGLLNHIRAKPTKSDIRDIEKLFGTGTRKVDIFHIGIQSVNGDFSLESDVTKIAKQQLLMLPISFGEIPAPGISFWGSGNTRESKQARDRKLGYRENQ